MSRYDQPKPVVKEFHDPLACEWDLALHWNFTSDGPLKVPAGDDDEDAGVKTGRHEILIRPNPSPDPRQLVVSQSLLRLLQENERLRFLAQEDGRLASLPPRRFIVITPTYKRTFQQLLMLGLINSLKRVQAPVLWVVIEATKTEETARLIAKATIGDSGSDNPEVEIAHLGVEEEMPEDWDERVLLEQRMRVVGLRYVRERRLDGIVVFADDGSVFSPKFFAEAQRVPWFGAGSVGVLLPVGFTDLMGSEEQAEEQSTLEGGGAEREKVAEGGEAGGTGGGVDGERRVGEMDGGEQRIQQGEERKQEGQGEWQTQQQKLQQTQGKQREGGNGVGDGDEQSLGGGSEEGLEGGSEEDSEGGSVAGSVAEGRLFDLLGAVVRNEKEVQLIGQCGRRVLVWWWRAEARQDSKFPAE
ncbi:unnamed protein product [Closterium sp. Naga37s-1]|nr:unnamed protein product [Closterium sp. Naga37s-1]